MKTSIIFSLLATATLTACAPSIDPAIKPGVESLNLAYITKVKPEDASFSKCEYKLIETRHIVQCGISFGSRELASIGFWEIVAEPAGPVAYALNGKALDALEKINSPNEFKSGAGTRPFLDIEKARQAFAN